MYGTPCIPLLCPWSLHAVRIYPVSSLVSIGYGPPSETAPVTLPLRSLGATANNMFAGGFMHADDIRTLAASASTLEAQISTVTKFIDEKLNATKCERNHSLVWKRRTLRLVKTTFLWAVKQHALDISGGRTCPPHRYLWSKITASRGPGRPSFSLAVPLPFRAS